MLLKILAGGKCVFFEGQRVSIRETQIDGLICVSSVGSGKSFTFLTFEIICCGDIKTITAGIIIIATNSTLPYQMGIYGLYSLFGIW